MVWHRRPVQPPEPGKSALPSRPPNPAAVREQIAAKKAAAEKQVADFVRSEVLPRVNAALRSATPCKYRVGRFTVSGDRTQVRVANSSREAASWVPMLVDALKQPAYASYTVQVYGRYIVTDRRRPEVELRGSDIAAAVQRFTRDHPRKSLGFVVKIRL